VSVDSVVVRKNFKQHFTGFFKNGNISYPFHFVHAEINDLKYLDHVGM